MLRVLQPVMREKVIAEMDANFRVSSRKLVKCINSWSSVRNYENNEITPLTIELSSDWLEGPRTDRLGAEAG